MHYSINLPKLLKGEIGMLLMGGFAHGLIRSLGGRPDEILVTSAPQDEGKPSFVLNANSVIFWKHDEPDLIAGQKLLARLILQKDVQEKYLASHRINSGPDRHNRSVGPGMDRRTAHGGRGPRRRDQGPERMLLSFAHNMALPQPHRLGHDRCHLGVPARRHDDARAGGDAAGSGSGERSAQR